MVILFIIFIIAMLGYGSYDSKYYWRNAVAAILILTFFPVLFNGGGGPGENGYDGYITAFIRPLLGDSFLFGIYGIAIVLLTWGAVGTLLVLGRKWHKENKDKN